MVGIGPGGPPDRTGRAVEAIAASNVVVGYDLYLKLISDITADKTIVPSGMTRERERCGIAVHRALQGDTVSLISSGDPGIYGMAGLAIEMASAEGINIPIEIIPGVTSATAAAAKLGAPLMCDYATISMSDLLVPWEIICKRIEAVADADMVVVIYNPRSRKRTRQLEEAGKIFRRHRPGSTPVGIATSVGCDDERIVLTDLDGFLHEEINMHSVVMIGNSSSKIVDGWFVTPRGYQL